MNDDEALANLTPTETEPVETGLFPVDTVAQAAAESLFPSMKAKEAPADHNQGTPEHIRALREGDTARKMFTAQSTHAEALPDELFETAIGTTLPDGTAITAEQAQSAAREWREIAADTGMSNNEVKQCINIFREVAANTESEAHSGKWRAESSKWLKDQHGEQSEKMLNLANKLIKRDSRIQQLILSNGALGNHPELVKMLVGAALRERNKGRL